MKINTFRELEKGQCVVQVMRWVRTQTQKLRDFAKGCFAFGTWSTVKACLLHKKMCSLGKTGDSQQN